MSGEPGTINVGQLIPDGTDMRWRKYTIPETRFTGGGLTEDVEVFSLPPGGTIYTVKIRHTTPFTGGGALTATLSVGIAGNLVKYAAAFDVLQAVSGTAFSINYLPSSENQTAATSIRAQLTVTVGTTGGITAGSADVWVLWAVAV